MTQLLIFGTRVEGIEFEYDADEWDDELTPNGEALPIIQFQYPLFREQLWLVVWGTVLNRWEDHNGEERSFLTQRVEWRANVMVSRRNSDGILDDDADPILFSSAFESRYQCVRSMEQRLRRLCRKVGVALS